MMMKVNRLAKEKSPYLLQHKNNPVDWYPWGEEAFAEAKKQNKPIFLSIGYSTCYWCHVMEKDSFEIDEVAQVMNKYFINIKVDREEHPEVDQIYMDAVMAMTGHGGWPMSVFLTPDLKPFVGATFLWRQQFLNVMHRIQEEWIKKPEKVFEFGEKVFEALSETPQRFSEQNYDDQILIKAYENLARRFDSQHGGFGGAPKFPHSADLSLLMRVAHRQNEKKALQMVVKSLDEMAKGGIYDHLGGGFHRYSTDDKWFAPHFEKMLYDNALLAVTYLEAYQLTKNEHYAKIARETLDFVLREMTSPEGGFYSAQDAGEVGREGDFYVWTYDELKSVLSENELQLLKDVYGVTETGNWEHGKNILCLQNGQPSQRDPLGHGSAPTQKLKEKLFQIRQQREHPHKDEKILTGWNGLMISAMAKAYQALADERYLVVAQKAAGFIKGQLYQKENLLRRFCDGESKYSAKLEDYAYLIQGLIDLYESDFDGKWLFWAGKLQNEQNQAFWDEKKGGYYFASHAEKNLVIRKKDFFDASIPSGNAVSLLNLLRLHDLTLTPSFQEKAKVLSEIFAGLSLKQSTLGYSSALIALDYVLSGAKEIAIIGDVNEEKTKTFLFDLYRSFVPNKVLACGAGLIHQAEQEVEASHETPLLLQGKAAINDQTTVYICQNHVCEKPLTDLDEVLEKII